MIKEACVETLQEAILAEKNGADRIELCSHLELDGLTPSMELMEQTCTKLSIPVMVMIRARGGNFVYAEEEVSRMKQEIELAKKAGASGIVLGLLTSDNKIDVHNTRILVNLAAPLPVTFHKAIDELANPVDGVKQLLAIDGITRILTSGGEKTAKQGAKKIREMIQVAGKRITILVAGKITSENIHEIQTLTGRHEFHGRRIVGELT